MPSCTNAERSRFENMLSQGHLVDAYKLQHAIIDDTGFTWQGYISPKIPKAGMRVDYLLVSELLLSNQASPVRVTRADRLEDRHGSDHHPLVLEFAFDNATTDSSTPPGPALAELSAELHVTTEVAQTSG